MNGPQNDNGAIASVENQDIDGQGRQRLLAAGGVVGALIASSCCVLPLVLVMLGISGAWVGNLTALEPYKLYFLSFTAIVLGIGFWHVYFRPKKACADGSYCARPGSSRITRIALWFAAILAMLSATVDYWAPLFY